MFYYNRGVTRYEAGDDKSAIADLTRALQDKPSDPQFRALCLVMRARCYINQAKSAPAMSDLNAAIKLHEDSEAYRLRGIVHKVAHEYDKSLADYEKAIALDPKNADAYGTEAYLLSVCPVPKYRDGAKAVRYATKACELTEWHEARAIDSLAAAYAETGDFDKAIQFQKQADEMDKKADPDRLALYEKHQPFRDLNRAEKAVPLPETGKVAIKLGEKLTAHFEVDGEELTNPTTAKGDHPGENSFALDFHLHNGHRLLLLQHSFSKIIRVRCLARLKDQDAYFETDLLPIPPHEINREIWSEQIEELVLFDFHFEGRRSEKSVTERAQTTKNTVRRSRAMCYRRRTSNALLRGALQIEIAQSFGQRADAAGSNHSPFVHFDDTGQFAHRPGTEHFVRAINVFESQIGFLHAESRWPRRSSARSRA